METKVLQGKEALKQAVEIIKSGGVVAFPTETVYGLGANAFDIDAVKKIFVAKGRPMDNPLIAHVGDIDQIKVLASNISESAKIVIDKFMPGPITIILPKSDIVDKSITAGLDTIGIRMPSHPIAQEFITMCNIPIVAPSANTSTRISPTRAEHVYDDMQGKIPLIIDGGQSQVGIESTIIDMTADVPTILRPGAITAQMLVKELGQVQTFGGQVIVAKAPGMKYKHYAPSCPMLLCQDINNAIDKYKELLQSNGNPIIIGNNEWAKHLDGIKHINVGETDIQVARNIYASLHNAQNIADYIICQDFGSSGIYGSIMNRLNKASGGNRI